MTDKFEYKHCQNNFRQKGICCLTGNMCCDEVKCRIRNMVRILERLKKENPGVER